MNLTAEELKEMLRKAWQMGAAAANAGVDEPILMDTEIEFLIDEVSP